MPKTNKVAQRKKEDSKQTNGIASKGKQVSKTAVKASNGQSKFYSNFLPITLEIPSSLPISSSSKTPYTHHTIYIRPHTAKSQTGETSGRTLFVVNLPVDISERDVRTVFGRWGVIESIEFPGEEGTNALEQAVLQDLNDDMSDEDDGEEEEEDTLEDAEGREGATIGAGATFQGDLKTQLPRRQRSRRKPTLPASVPEVVALPPLKPRDMVFGPSGLRGAHVTYLDAQPVSTAMSNTATVRLDKYNAGISSGLAYYTSLHSALRPALGAVKEFADSSMARFDHLSSMLLSARAKKQGAGALVDEDGFTVVVRGGRYGRTGGRGKGVASVGVASRGFKGDEKVKGKGAGELPDFYRFQQVDRKRKELADLRSKFEQDKIKVEEMKRSKRFKPY